MVEEKYDVLVRCKGAMNSSVVACGYGYGTP